MKDVARSQEGRIGEKEWPPANLPVSTYEMIQRGAAIDSAAPALSFFLRADMHEHPEVWDYAALLRRITQAANSLYTLGVRKDDVVCFLLPNLPETHFTIWGAETTGIAAAINPLLEPASIISLLTAMRATVLVTLAPTLGSDLWRKLKPALAGIDSLRHVMLVDLADRVPAAKQPFDYAELRKGLPPNVDVHDFNATLDQQPADRLLSERIIEADDVASLFCTGGTTGLPKIAKRRHGNEIANTWMLTQTLPGLKPGKSIFCGMPLFHVNAGSCTGLFPFSVGAQVILGTPQGYRGEGVIPRFWEIVERHRVNFFMAVPTVYAALLQVPIGKHDLSSLEYGICGAAPMPTEVFRRFETASNIKILEGYGLTETTAVSSLNPVDGERRIGSVGICLPAQSMKAVVLDADGHYLRDCAVDETGVLTISGPNVFAGYLSDEHNRGIWLDLGDARRWLNTGDLGRQDADGYFWLAGRKKELIIRGGHNIDPAAIEGPLLRHPDVQFAAAVARPDAYAGELPVAYVQLKPGSTATEAELTEFAANQIGERAAQPKQVRIIDIMPLTAVGKIFKPALKRREIAETLAAALRQAGIAFELTVLENKTQGDVLRAMLFNASDEAAARDILGQFTVPFEIAVTPNLARGD